MGTNLKIDINNEPSIHGIERFEDWLQLGKTGCYYMGYVVSSKMLELSVLLSDWINLTYSNSNFKKFNLMGLAEFLRKKFLEIPRLKNEEKKISFKHNITAVTMHRGLLELARSIQR